MLHCTNKWSKNFDERPHRRGVIFHGGQCNMTPTKRKHCSRFCCSNDVIEYWMIPFYCIHRSRHSKCSLMGRTTPAMSII